jgi:hypothetical protein
MIYIRFILNKIKNLIIQKFIIMVHVFAIIFLNSCLKKSYHKIFWNEIILQNAFESSCRFEAMAHYFISKIQYYMFKI